jgi:tRNA (uracil-5-)-methyltransferase
MSSILAKEIGDDSFSLTYMNFDEDGYHAQLQEKVSRTAALFDMSPDRIEVFESSKRHFRNRVRFAVVEEEDERIECVHVAQPFPHIRYAKYECGSASVLVNSFPIACELTNKAMKSLPKLLAGCSAVIQRPKAVHFLTSTTQECLVVTLIYNRPLVESEWMAESEELKTNLMVDLGIADVSIIAKTKGVKLVVGTGFVVEDFLLPGASILFNANLYSILLWFNFIIEDGRRVKYKQVEDGFSNPNGAVNRLSLGWLSSVARSIHASTSSSSTTSGDLLELYCGNGNHSVALSVFSGRAVAVELNRSLCAAARENLALNGVTNVSIVHGDSAKFSSSILRLYISPF